jgi:hypothetical protein
MVREKDIIQRFRTLPQKSISGTPRSKNIADLPKRQTKPKVALKK